MKIRKIEPNSKTFAGICRAYLRGGREEEAVKLYLEQRARETWQGDRNAREILDVFEEERKDEIVRELKDSEDTVKQTTDEKEHVLM